MEQQKSITKCAGIDAAKAKLDVAVHGQEDQVVVDNDAAGHDRLVGWLRQRGVSRVGIEATGGYERAVVRALEKAGFDVIVHQPAQIRAFARFKRIRAKNDRIDARLIAAATAMSEGVKAACDPRLAELAERLTAYEQAAQLLAELKTCLEHVSLPDLKAQYLAKLKDLAAWKRALAKDLLDRIRRHPDLARRLDLLMSMPGIAQIIAASLLVRMPELGGLKRGQAASLLGVAPFDRDSGLMKGERHIFGGRARPRRMVYLAAIVAKRIDPALRTLAQHMAAQGKKPKVIIVALMRKLIEAANLVLARQRPWTTNPA